MEVTVRAIDHSISDNIVNVTSSSDTIRCWPNRHDWNVMENLAEYRDRLCIPKDRVSTAVAQALAINGPYAGSVAGSQLEPPPETQPITCNIPERLLLLEKDFLMAGLILKIVLKVEITRSNSN